MLNIYIGNFFKIYSSKILINICKNLGGETTISLWIKYYDIANYNSNPEQFIIFCSCELEMGLKK